MRESTRTPRHEMSEHETIFLPLLLQYIRQYVMCVTCTSLKTDSLISIFCYDGKQQQKHEPRRGLYPQKHGRE